jgi:hypothetical protein
MVVENLKGAGDVRSRQASAVAAMAIALTLSGCAVAGAADTAGQSTPVGVSAAPTPCAEFPAGISPEGPDFEGWWSSAPADADGTVLTDPADWPAQMREHPRTALVDAATGRVVSTWDRLACGPIHDFTTPSQLTGSQIVVLDADTGDILETLAARG